MPKVATINYGFGIARLWGDFTAETVERVFYKHANQCFGIRKSISCCTVTSIKDDEFPKVFGVKPDRIAVVLMHSGDTIVWGRSGKKIKSEFD
ncbi:hypothetical protein [Brevundimonas phoenicis]|uniref:hypothetical protein n=1 Tax=unclassified Brevundimonas TaxID=2622653 RepID=UPI0039A2F3D8